MIGTVRRLDRDVGARLFGDDAHGRSLSAIPLNRDRL